MHTTKKEEESNKKTGRNIHELTAAVVPPLVMTPRPEKGSLTKPLGR
jgi:hypothetical protein